MLILASVIFFGKYAPWILLQGLNKTRTLKGESGRNETEGKDYETG